MAAELSFATFNLKNLQLPGKAMYPNSRPYAQTQYDAKIGWTADKVREVDADVIGFQELWDQQCLNDVFAAAGLVDDYDLVTTDQTGRVNNACAVRSPHDRTFSHYIGNFPDDFALVKRGGPTASIPEYRIRVNISNFSRPVLRVTIQPMIDSHPNLPAIAVLVAHLKSKRPMDVDQQEEDTPALSRPDKNALGAALAAIRRNAEAAALRMVLNSAMTPPRPVVVLGDLNDAQLSVPLEIISGARKYRLFASSRSGRRADKGLYAAATMQEYRSLRDVYYTHIHEGIRESLDHVLVSQHFYDYATSRVWTFKEMVVYNDHLEDEDEAPEVSDHAIVKAVFDVA